MSSQTDGNVILSLPGPGVSAAAGIDIPLPGGFDWHFQVDYENGVTQLISFLRAQFTYQGNPIGPLQTLNRDYRDPHGNWYWVSSINNVEHNFIVESQGFQSPNGGLGNFTTTVTATPEPASFGLVAGSILLLAARALRRAV